MRTFDDPAALAAAAADDFIALIGEGVFHVALSGGSTPKVLFDELARRGRDALPWERVHLWWGDERCVPPGDPDSNFGMAEKHLIRPLDLINVHRMEGELAPELAAAKYSVEMIGALGAPPVFDLVWLGLGTDGHTASLFPGTLALDEKSRNVVPSISPANQKRITLTFPALANARHTRFLVTGADKGPALDLVGLGDVPAGKVAGADVQWFVDRAARDAMKSPFTNAPS
ncbi:MAG TPA: 6-phosphogluconolactonase [Kofleriaceae bacterium]|jgi:6-phosphogluconolactonase